MNGSAGPLLCLALLACPAAAAQGPIERPPLEAPLPGEPIAAGLAEDTVEVKVNYSGARIVLFATSPFGEDPATGFAVALIGPSAPQTVLRRTAAGRERFEFVAAPTVFAIGAEPQVAETVTPETMILAGLNAAGSAMPEARNLASPDLALWRAAFVELKMDQQLYSLDETTIERLDGGLRRVRINLPANAPTGVYRVRAVAFQNGQRIGETEQTLTLIRGGMDATLFDLSRKHGVIYGFLAVLLGSLVGLIAAWVGRR
ncbi:MAG: TIGR02186 family protein [Alphaproteobacteria bacterium]|nr:TIGR02186 family protein [Alphaproteobacteria bacterium]